MSGDFKRYLLFICLNLPIFMVHQPTIFWVERIVLNHMKNQIVRAGIKPALYLCKPISFDSKRNGFPIPKKTAGAKRNAPALLLEV